MPARLLHGLTGAAAYFGALALMWLGLKLMTWVSSRIGDRVRGIWYAPKPTIRLFQARLAGASRADCLARLGDLDQRAFELEVDREPRAAFECVVELR